MSKIIDVNVSGGIKVGGHVYKVKSGKQVSARLKEGNYYGRCYHTEKEILVDNTVSPCMHSNNIIHETVHAISDCYGAKLSESQVSRLTNGLHQVMESLGVRFVTCSSRSK